MNLSLRQIFKTLFPYILVLLLWRLSLNFWNPCGVLALIPIFYFSFIKPVAWFTFFAVIFCFLIDYNCDSLLFWTSIYCIFYAFSRFQSLIDLTRQEKDGLFMFMSFFGFGILVLTIIGFNFIGLIHSVWLFLWASILYIPIVALSKRITNDR